MKVFTRRKFMKEENNEPVFTIYPARQCHAFGALVNGRYGIRATSREFHRRVGLGTSG
ncbi:MAG: hypothetical protein ACREOO_10680 [bacterium]